MVNNKSRRGQSRWPAPQVQLPITARQKQIADLYAELGSGMAVARQLNLSHSTVYEALSVYREKREAQQ